MTTLPGDEALRLAVLREHRILDTPPQEEFDDLVRLAAHICGAPIAAVSLVDEHRQWFKAITGLNVTQTPREAAFCAHTILQREVMVVPDARADTRFADNPLVTGEPHVRFYAGMPLLTEDGHALGSLCVIDRKARTLTPAQEEALRLLGRQAASHLRAARRLADKERAVAERERLVAEKERAEAERRRTADALEAEREFTRALLESLQEGIVACDADGTLTLFNPATRAMHGLPEQPLPPERWAEHFDLYHADGLTPMSTQDIPLFRALQGEVVRDVEMVIAPKHGPARTILAGGQAIRAADGRKLGAVVAMHDVTERRGIEREVSRLAAIVESSEEAIIAGTLDGTIVSWNRAAERLYGYAASEAIGRHSSVLAQPHERGRWAGIVARMTRGEAIESLEVVRARRDGSTVDVSLALSPIKDSAGDVVGVSCISRDITDRKRAAAALRASEARLAEAQRVARVGSWEYDPATGRVTWSDQLFRLFGLDPADGEPDLAGAVALYHPDDVPALEAAVARAARTGVGYALDLRRAPDGGPERWYHTVGTAVTGPDGAVARLAGTLTDVTERKALEADLRESADRLRRSEASLRTLLESAPLILYAADADGTVTLSEGAGLAGLGLKPGETVGRNLRDFQGEGADAQGADATRRALAGEAVTYTTRAGGLWLHVALQPVRGAGGEPAGLIGVCLDVTERVASEERFRVLFEQSSDAHVLVDLVAGGGIIDCNPAAVALLGCADKAQLVGLHPAALSPETQPDGRPSREKGLEMEALARRDGCHRFEWTHRRVDGGEFPAEITLTPVTLAGRPAMLSVWHDLTERKRAEREAEDYRVVLEFQKGELERANAELEALATTDGLTGLKNHRAFQERLAEELNRAARYGTPLSVLLLDVDHFKQYNDSFGHPAGDEVLRAVAAVLRRSARDSDLAARYGGEEFVVILPQTDAAGARAIAERIRRRIAEVPWSRRAVTASVGVASLEPDVEGCGDLIARADAALYTAKAGGRNRVAQSRTSDAVPRDSAASGRSGD